MLNVFTYHFKNWPIKYEPYQIHSNLLPADYQFVSDGNRIRQSLMGYTCLLFGSLALEVQRTNTTDTLQREMGIFVCEHDSGGGGDTAEGGLMCLHQRLVYMRME